MHELKEIFQVFTVLKCFSDIKIVSSCCSLLLFVVLACCCFVIILPNSAGMMSIVSTLSYMYRYILYIQHASSTKKPTKLAKLMVAIEF